MAEAKSAHQAGQRRGGGGGGWEKSSFPLSAPLAPLLWPRPRQRPRPRPFFGRVRTRPTEVTDAPGAEGADRRERNGDHASELDDCMGGGIICRDTWMNEIQPSKIIKNKKASAERTMHAASFKTP